MHAVLPLCVWSKWDSFLAAKAVMAWSLPAPATDGQDHHSLEQAARVGVCKSAGRATILSSFLIIETPFQPFCRAGNLTPAAEFAAAPEPAGRVVKPTSSQRA